MAAAAAAAAAVAPTRRVNSDFLRARNEFISDEIYSFVSGVWFGVCVCATADRVVLCTGDQYGVFVACMHVSVRATDLIISRFVCFAVKNNWMSAAAWGGVGFMAAVYFLSEHSGVRRFLPIPRQLVRTCKDTSVCLYV